VLTLNTFPDVPAFDKVDSGVEFQGAYLIAREDDGSTRLLALFYANASYFGQSLTHHPIYSGYNFLVLNWFIIYVWPLFLVIVMNLHE
jgi:hypothetical protein